jgi:hypothetical protein
MPSHLMIDIESLDTSPNCVILTIGVVKFNPKGTGVLDRLELKPTIEDQTEVYNRIINEDTLRWWSQQSPEALNAAFNEQGRMSLKECMKVLYHYCWNQDAVWANGAPFDVVVMETAFRQTLTDRPNPIPWPFYTVRDTRTLFEIAGVKLKDKKYGTKTTHNAVEDAEHQAIVVQDAYQKLIAAGLMKP